MIYRSESNVKETPIQDFCIKHGFTIPQVRSACYRGTFDSRMETLSNKGRGGARRRIIVLETNKTLNQVERMKTWDRGGAEDNSRFKSYAKMVYSFNK